jgi:adenine deaminase
MGASFQISGQVYDITTEEFIGAIIRVDDGMITAVTPIGNAHTVHILPGLIDAHVHIESSMLVPSEFARMAVVHGTVATISDPHEIANVCGVAGVEFMITNGSSVPFKFNFGAPSCVPATGFETAGATLDLLAVESLMKRPEVKYLAEMMNWPAVLAKDSLVMDKINAALREGKVVDGHAPGLTGEQAKLYSSAGITTDHECFTRDEALSKLSCGMKILIREGSAAKNFDGLIDLLNEYPDRIMFCSDDKHPDSLEAGHINELVKRAVRKGIPWPKIIKATSINPVMHYKLNVGLLRVGDPADFIVIDDLNDFNVRNTYINGVCVAERGLSKIASVPTKAINNFQSRTLGPEEFHVKCTGKHIRVIEALEGQLITNELILPVKEVAGLAVADVDRDILKLTVVNRYSNTTPSIGFICNFGLKDGALASSVAHDSHNIIAVGTSDEAIAEVVNAIMQAGGGVAAKDSDGLTLLPLPVAGLMSAQDGYEVSAKYKAIDHKAKAMGSHLAAPFMTLSFMALLVIPNLKLSDKGLFDAAKFRFTELLVE